MRGLLRNIERIACALERGVAMFERFLKLEIAAHWVQCAACASLKPNDDGYTQSYPAGLEACPRCRARNPMRGE